MRLPLLVLSLSIALAGCMGGGADDPVEAASADGTAADAGSGATPTPGTPSTKPSATPGSPSPASPSTGAAANATATNGTLVEVPYSWTSTLSPSVCAPTLPGSCAGLFAAGWWDRPSLEGTPQKGKLELTWTTSPGGPAEMRFVLLRATSCGDDCWEGETIQQVSGASPLLIEADIELGEEQFVIVAARAASLFPDPLFGFAHTEQDVAVQGTFTVLQP